MKKHLIIGYGSKLRGDDALGPCIVESLWDEADLDGKNIQTMSLPQLDIALATILSEADTAIFVDARDDESESLVEVQQIVPLPGPVVFSHTSHTMGVPLLLRIALDWYGAAPECYAVMPKGFDYSIGESISEQAQLAARCAREKIVELLDLTSKVPTKI